VETTELTQKESGPTEKWVALLGRRDFPADGITDYCGYLGQNLAPHGIELRMARVEWVEKGWLRSARHLLRQSKQWRGLWVLPQYTALGWSRRGFPLGIVITVAMLRMRGARCAMVFHEPWGTEGPRLVDRIRCRFQNWTVRTLYRLSEKNIFTIPLSTIPWLPKDYAKCASIPLGPNIPENLTNRSALQNQNGNAKTVVVFCVSESPHGEREIGEIAAATRLVKSAGLEIRVIFVGRGTTEAKSAIDRAFADSSIEVCNRGLCEAEEVSRIFSESDAMVAVRGKLYLRRGSALAGLACGLPIVGYSGAATGTIIEEAGVTLVPFGDKQALGAALREILTTPAIWKEMHEKNLRIQEKYLSWKVIAGSYADFLAGRSA
jgi:glycosyltransferase involved in cell wall biosynthesis